MPYPLFLLDSGGISRRRGRREREWQRLIHELEETLLQFIGNVYDLIQWPGVVILMALETVVFMIPSEAVMTLAGWMLIKAKGLGPEWIIFAGLLGGLGSTIGSIIMYYIGVWGARPLVRSYGRYFFVAENDLDAAERFFDRWGTWAVFLGRMVPLVRTFVSIPAGTARMDLRRFTVYTFAGSFIWAALLAWGGYVLGENWTDLRDWMGPADIVIATLFSVFVVWYFVQHVRRAWRSPQPSGPEA